MTDSTAALPRILLIDDRASERVEGIRSKLKGRASVSAVDPLEVEPDDLLDADLISVDEFLGDEWDSFIMSDGAPLTASIRNRDGLAVAASIRSQARIGKLPRPLAITLHTGEITELAQALPAANREALVAAQHDLEWVFQFETGSLAERMLALAEASMSLINSAGIIRDDFGAKWLRVPDAPWAAVAVAQIEDTRPPAHSMAEATAGRSYLRWLAHRVLPYPTFLLNKAHAANLLGIEEESFELIASHVTKYEGPLRGLLGDRWWRASLQQLLVDQGLNTWDSSFERAAALSSAFGLSLVPLGNQQAVVSYDSDGSVADIDTNPEESVRLQLDGWPVWADDPWATVASVRRDDQLRRTVTHSDLPRIESTR
ncbi:hypothetical protein [Curtobacterium flaccumfaciens]|uniref:hypothetical protein n=1 Tax=Curtobacterium flaccumfaciens TaxID=2035 RepID=UPI003EC0EB2B